MVLDDILSLKRKEIEASKRRTPLTTIRRLAEQLKEPKRSLEKALSTGKKLHLICELKKASPSEGVLRNRFQPAVLAQEFEAAGASAISVLTEKHFFKGSPETLKRIRPLTTIPLIRKDFIFDPYQVYETVLIGADAFLVITMLITSKELKGMLDLAKSLNLEVLVEVHTRQELDRAIQAGSKIIGINNRNLKTLKVNRHVSEQLLKFVPKSILTVIESGIETKQEITRYQALGVHSFLIGTALMKSPNVKQKILELSHQPNGVF